MQQPPPPPTFNSGSLPPPSPSNPITTEQIQKFLEENRNLILAIMENQNLGKFTECGQLQNVLQKNLMYLAAIADSQPPPSGLSQVPANSVAQQGNYLQQQQAQGAAMAQQQQAQGAAMAQQQPAQGAAMAQQQQAQGGGGLKLPFQLNNAAVQRSQQDQQQQQQQQLLHFQQQQIQQMGLMRPGPGGAYNPGIHQALQHGGGLGNKQDGPEAAASGADGQGKSASGRGGGSG